MNAAEDRGTTYNILFVCTGNTCRSPMAAAFARRAISERGWSHVQVDSAGTQAVDGAPPSVQAVEVLREIGLDLSDHTTRRLTRDHVEWADLILGMSPSHVEVARELGAGEKVYLVTDFLEGPAAGDPIEDPYGGERVAYEEVRDRIRAGVEAVLDRLSAILAP